MLDSYLLLFEVRIPSYYSCWTKSH